MVLPRQPQDFPEWMRQLNARVEALERGLAQLRVQQREGNTRKIEPRKPEPSNPWPDDEITARIGRATDDELGATARLWRERAINAEAQSSEVGVILTKQIARQDKMIKALLGAIILLVTVATAIIKTVKP